VIHGVRKFDPNPCSCLGRGHRPKGKVMNPSKNSIMRPYEAVILLHPDTSESDQKALFLKNEKIVTQFSGSVNHVDTWGKRKLANHIKNQKRAIFFHTTFEASSGAIAEMERTMLINDKVLRFFHKGIGPKVNVAKHLEIFRTTISESVNREKEREAKFQKTRYR